MHARGVGSWLAALVVGAASLSVQPRDVSAVDPPDDNDDVVRDTALESFSGLPDRDSHSGVFLDVISTGNDSIVSTLHPWVVEFTFGADVLVPKIFIWDGNNAGLWDQNGVSTTFPLFARPPIADVVTDFDLSTDGAGPAVRVRHGESEITPSVGPPPLQLADVVFRNAVDGRWEPYFTGPHHPNALLPTGEHRYRLKVQFRSDKVSALNAYKVAANGAVAIVPGNVNDANSPQAMDATPEIVGGYIGGVVDGLNLDNVPTIQGNYSVSRDPYPEMLTPDPAMQLPTSYGHHFRNDYHGTIDILVRLTPPPGVSFADYLKKVVLMDGDLDDREDLTEMNTDGTPRPHIPRPGLPADQGGPYTAPRNPAPGEPYIQYDTTGFAIPTKPDPASISPNGNPYLEVYSPDVRPPAAPILVCTDLSGTTGADGQGFERIPIPGTQKPGVWLLRFRQVDARNSIFISSMAALVAGSSGIEGRVFCDANMNGSDEEGQDLGIAGVGVLATRIDVANGPVFHATTDLHGAWRVEPIPPGTYRVDVDRTSPALAGHAPTSPTTLQVVVAEGQIRADTDFGFACGVGGRVFCDMNGNGTNDEGDSGIAGVNVKIAPEGCGDAFTVATDDEGYWHVDSLAPCAAEVSVDAGQAALSGKTALGPTSIHVSGPLDVTPLGFAFLCGPCDCDGDTVKKVGMTAQLWVGTQRRCYDFAAEMRAGCGDAEESSAAGPLEDSIVFRWYAGSTGPWKGPDGIIQVNEVSVADGVATVQFSLTATGPRSPRGVFEGGHFVKVQVVGCDYDGGCDALTCANTRPGMRWPPCPADQPDCDTGFGVTWVETAVCGSVPPPPPPCGCVQTADWWADRCVDSKRRQPWTAPCAEDAKICGRSWICVLGTSPRCDPWLTLAREWIAASLNRCAGACLSTDIASAVSESEGLLSRNCCQVNRADRTRILDLAALLKRFNQGELGSPACGATTTSGIRTGNVCKGRPGHGHSVRGKTDKGRCANR